MTRRLLLAFSLLVTACLFFASCSLGGKRGDKKQLPASIGQPYEVLLEGDTLDIVKAMLTEDVDILPQPEPMCNVISVKRGKVSGSYLLMRTRVIVTIGKNFSVKVSHDENAAPQTIIRIHAASLQELRDSLQPRVLQTAIYEAELEHLAAVVKQNPEKQKLVKRLFGIDIKIPDQLDASKEAKNFLWLSNNANRGMQNLIFVRVESEEFYTINSQRRNRQYAAQKYDWRNGQHVYATILPQEALRQPDPRTLGDEGRCHGRSLQNEPSATRRGRDLYHRLRICPGNEKEKSHEAA